MNYASIPKDIKDLRRLSKEELRKIAEFLASAIPEVYRTDAADAIVRSINSNWPHFSLPITEKYLFNHPCSYINNLFDWVTSKANMYYWNSIHMKLRIGDIKLQPFSGTTTLVSRKITL